MYIRVKVFSRCLVGVLALGLIGYGCLFPSTPNTVSNLYVELYSEADYLQYIGEYRRAVEKYEQAFKIRPRPTKIIDVRFPALFTYSIAFCYAKLAEAEGDISLYTKSRKRQSWKATKP